ncbi:MAG TPA: hypothetical protein VKV29_09595 [Chthonomonas sp.]|uniref:hypothetical protein n=1 Tax=Chthonomonas sp. TaxID=2282153 RepID=UPI002B4B7555|nr:hypothetical protein [Chthonomonas sp.]HLG77069.1 hypothetical protein [Ktedonobacteraceae bacterium]HLH80520.1 hypothetical protein [Chthonomonas sp.]
MGWFQRLRGTQSQGAQPKRLPVMQSQVWALKAENAFFHLISWGFSGVSAFAIWQIFVSRHAGDLGRMIEGAVIAFCFGVAGYFLSRNIAFRWMSGEMVFAYIPVCLVVEVVEIYCNYVVGVSYLDLSDFFQTIPLDQHALLLTIGRIVVSSIPAMTLFLAVAQMDLERRKLQAMQQQPKQPSPSTYGVASYHNGYQAQQQPVRGQQPGGNPSVQGVYQAPPVLSQNGAASAQGGRAVR